VEKYGGGLTVSAGRGACFYTTFSLPARVGHHFEEQNLKNEQSNQRDSERLSKSRKGHTHLQQGPSTAAPGHFLDERKTFLLKKLEKGRFPGWISADLEGQITLLEILDHAAEVESSMTETISLVQIQPIPPIFCHSNARGTPEQSVKVEFTTRSTPQGRGGGALAQWPQKNYKSF